MARLRSPMPCRPPCLFSHLNTRPAMYQRKGRRRVQHRAVLRHRLEIHERGRAGTRLAEQIVAHDHEREACRADVLLRAGVDQTELRHVDRPRQDGRRHVGDQRHVAGISARSGTPRRRWSRSACSADTPRRACSFQRATGRNRAVRLACVGGDVDLAVVLRFADAPSSTRRPCSRSRRRCPAVVRFIGTPANCAVAPPCRNSTL